MLKATVVLIRVTLDHLKVTKGHLRVTIHSVVSGQSADSWSCYKKIGQSADSTRACLSAALLWLEWKSVFTLSYLLG